MSKKIAIMAGNPRVEWKKVGNNDKGELVIDAQLEAFKEAMKIIEETHDQVMKVAILFDHKGRFRDQFLDETQRLTKRQKESLKLSYLHPKIRVEYEGEAKIPLDQISVISEDVCRTFVKRKDELGELNAGLRVAVISSKKSTNFDESSCCCGPMCKLVGDYEDGVNCAGIHAGSLYYLAKDLDPNTYMVSCQEYDSEFPARIDFWKIMKGTLIAYKIFGLKNKLEQRLLFPLKTEGFKLNVQVYSPEEMNVSENSKNCMQIDNISITKLQ